MLQDKINAQIKLLEDTDKEVFALIRENLISQGEEIVPILESAWDKASLPIVHERIENIIHTIHFQTIQKRLEIWRDSAQQDWTEPLFILSKFYYQDLDEAFFKDMLQPIANAVWLEMHERLTSLEKVRLINRVFFQQLGFKNDMNNGKKHIHYFLMKDLLETKKGNDISLAFLYLWIAQQLDMPIYPVNLPGNLILAYVDYELQQTITVDSKDSDVLFYINPSVRGSLFDKNEIISFLDKNNLKHKKEYFTPASPTDIMIRAIKEMQVVFLKNKQEEKVSELDVLLQILNK